MQHNPYIFRHRENKKDFTLLTKLFNSTGMYKRKNAWYYDGDWPLELKSEIIAYISYYHDTALQFIQRKLYV